MPAFYAISKITQNRTAVADITSVVFIKFIVFLVPIIKVFRYEHKLVIRVAKHDDKLSLFSV